MVEKSHSQKIGLQFEKEFKSLCGIQGITCIRIPDGSKIVSNRLSVKKYYQVKIKSPFDFLLTKDGKVCVLDCKSTSQKRFSYSKININQLTNLIQCSQSICAGYLVKFKHLEYYIFYDANTLANLESGESLSIEDGKIVELTNLEVLFCDME